MFYKEALCVVACPTEESPEVKCPPDAESQGMCNKARSYGLVFRGDSTLGVCLPKYDLLPKDAK